MWSAHHSRLQTHLIRPPLSTWKEKHLHGDQSHIESCWCTASHSMERVKHSTQRPFIYFLWEKGAIHQPNPTDWH